MQTFLPYKDFAQSAKALDYRRLGKQRVEAFQLLKGLMDPSYGWNNHPASKMWRGYEDALGIYMNACIEEWVARGYKNTMLFYTLRDDGVVQYPKWLGDEAFHASHRSNLLRKDEKYYRKFGWQEPTDLPYVWPTV